MLHKQGRRGGGFSSLLEREAAEYFKLDLSQMELNHHHHQQQQQGGRRRQVSTRHHSNSRPESFVANQPAMPAATAASSIAGSSRRFRLGQPSPHYTKDDTKSKGYKPSAQSETKATQTRAAGSGGPGKSRSTEITVSRVLVGCGSQNQNKYPKNESCTRNETRRQVDTGSYQDPTVVVGSSTTSTNSLPSITSSPSVSPSLVCPHLSLDDILDYRQGSSGSPHTIGLCPKCRLDPPPNIHSPLSPQFRPQSRSCSSVQRRTNGQSSPLGFGLLSPKRVRRGYSDHHASYCSIKQARKQQQQQQQQQQSQQSSPKMGRRQSDLGRLRDDSLDFCLEPDELRRMQLSPTMRNSVEFIRRNSIESGRVVRIYKNGEPFEKPLRICILRGEFATLNHLLDHINSRLLVPSGARYLFHLDGQLVYSVHELKHGSAYVVSGTRSYDYRTSEVLKEQQKRDQLNRVSLEQKVVIKQQLEIGGGHSSRQTGLDGGSLSRTKTKTSSGVNPVESRRETKSKSVTSDHERSQGERTTARPLARPKQTDQRVPISFRSIEPHTSANKPSGKFSRHGGTTTLASSGAASAAASDQSVNLTLANEKPIKFARAKSELSALPLKKQKKNVTFKDTGRGSSPAISDLSSSGGETATSLSTRRTVSTITEPPTFVGIEPPEGNKLKNELSTSEVGIQVSNSIDGFLIDLPVPLPAKGDDSSLADRPMVRQNVGHKQSKGDANRRTEGGSGGSGTKVPPVPGKTKHPRQIVTITERQLSHEEMTELTDLSEGDHHDHHEVIIEWELPPKAEQQQHQKHRNSDSEFVELVLVPDRSDTITIGTDPLISTVSTPASSSRLVTSAVNQDQDQDTAADRPDGHWQYPSDSGGVTSTTPTERPVSQIEPNESVRARVTTPTPSLSTGGDNNSLTLSYDTVSMGAICAQDSTQEVAARLKPKPKRPPGSELPVKQRIEVMGTLCDGLDSPSRNFRLVWVNGFAINDLYPENSVDVQQLAETEAAASTDISKITPTVAEPTSPSASRLSPNRQRPSAGGKQKAEFKPSERYHNWICHSKKHDELVYPSGALIVLWCRWNNEQRYYARHTSNVSCLTLATLDSDLAASAQASDQYEKRQQTGSLIHLWSLSSLALLHVIDDDQFRSKVIFSMRMKCTKAVGCELSVAARDEKQLFLLEFVGKLKDTTTVQVNDEKKVDTFERRGSKGGTTSSTSSKQQQHVQSGHCMMRASKVLQSNQLPLYVLRVPTLTGFARPNEANSSSKQQQTEPLISFGRRHFSIWAPDVKQKKLRPMQADQKSAKFVELVGKANCLCRVSPDEFLLGDSDGNVVLLLIDCGLNQTPTTRAPGVKVRRVQPKAGISTDSADLRYSIKTIELLVGGASTNATKLDKSSRQSISCLTRVSGSIFMSADASCTIRFWKIKRRANSIEMSQPPSNLGQGSGNQHQISCEQLSSISLPPDLGFICTIILAQYKLKESIVEFYVVSTSNSILFGSVKLPQQLVRRNKSSSSTATGSKPDSEQKSKPEDLLANSSLSVVYEGHETSASGLVADSSLRTGKDGEPPGWSYFTCSLDCRICKWNGKQLIWKSMLPSSCVSLAVHPTGSVLAVGSVDGTVYILDKGSGLLISYFPLTPVRINCLAYSSDGSLLASGCANGSIFMLPVDERGLKYRKVSIFQSPNAVVSLQFSLDNRYMLTSVSHGSYQELILWDLPNFRYMRDDVKLAADKIQWFDSICSGSEDVRAIWENAHLSDQIAESSQVAGSSLRSGLKRLTNISSRSPGYSANKLIDQFVVNLSCHRLIKQSNREPSDEGNTSQQQEGFVIASDTRGYLRLFRYPAYDIQQGFYAIRIGSSAVNCCRFLGSGSNTGEIDHFVSTSLDGSICLWALE